MSSTLTASQLFLQIDAQINRQKQKTKNKKNDDADLSHRSQSKCMLGCRTCSQPTRLVVAFIRSISPVPAVDAALDEGEGGSSNRRRVALWPWWWWLLLLFVSSLLAPPLLLFRVGDAQNMLATAVDSADLSPEDVETHLKSGATSERRVLVTLLLRCLFPLLLFGVKLFRGVRRFRGVSVACEAVSARRSLIPQ